MSEEFTGRHRRLTARYYIASIVDEDILPDAVIAMDDRDCPHLTSQEPQPLHDGVRKSIEGNLVWSTRVVGGVRLFLDPLVPVVSVTVQCPNTMAIDTNIIATNHERSRLILVTNWKRCVQPILNIGAPLFWGQRRRDTWQKFTELTSSSPCTSMSTSSRSVMLRTELT